MKTIKTALIIVDVQNDFCRGGNLSVENAEDIIEVINEMRDKYDVVIATQDWHQKDHKSFFTNNPGAKPFSLGKLSGKDQVMWPPHCIQGSLGAEFHPKLKQNFDKIFQKGQNSEVDSYSGFFDNDQISSTGLSEYLKEREVTHVTVVGLALDYCVKATAIDAQKEGFDSYINLKATRAVTQEPSELIKLMEELEELDLI